MWKLLSRNKLLKSFCHFQQNTTKIRVICTPTAKLVKNFLYFVDLEEKSLGNGANFEKLC